MNRKVLTAEVDIRTRSLCLVAMQGLLNTVTGDHRMKGQLLRNFQSNTLSLQVGERSLHTHTHTYEDTHTQQESRVLACNE